MTQNVSPLEDKYTYTNDGKYSGAQYEVAAATSPQAASQSKLAEVILSGAKASVASAYALDDAIVKRLDWTLQQQRLETAKTLTFAVKNDLESRLALKDGEKGSVFNADHTFNRTALKDFYRPYQEKLKDFGKGYIDPDMQQQALEAKEQLVAGLNMQTAALLGAATKARAKQALDNNFWAYLNAGDPNGAMELAIRSLEAGACSPADVSAYERQAEESAAAKRARRKSSKGEGKITSFEQIMTLMSDD